MIEDICTKCGQAVTEHGNNDMAFCPRCGWIKHWIAAVLIEEVAA